MLNGDHLWNTYLKKQMQAGKRTRKGKGDHKRTPDKAFNPNAKKRGTFTLQHNSNIMDIK